MATRKTKGDLATRRGAGDPERRVRWITVLRYGHLRSAPVVVGVGYTHGVGTACTPCSPCLSPRALLGRLLEGLLPLPDVQTRQVGQSSLQAVQKCARDAEREKNVPNYCDPFTWIEGQVQKVAIKSGYQRLLALEGCGRRCAALSGGPAGQHHGVERREVAVTAYVFPLVVSILPLSTPSGAVGVDAPP